MSNDARTRLLEVAARVYAEAGYRGTTTRRIAQESGLNEVTLFRHFGSKDALLREAIEHADTANRPMLDFDSEDPGLELRRWGRETYDRYYASRNLIRQILGDTVDRPGIAPRLSDDQLHEYRQLHGFLAHLADRDLITERDPSRMEAAGAMLLHSLLSNALWRDLVPEIPLPEACVQLFVEMTLRALGARSTVSAGARP